MGELISPEILRYCEAHTSPESDTGETIAAETHNETSNPGMLVGHSEGTFLSLVARSTGALKVLEIGTFTGYSALKFAEGIPEDGEVITCDIDTETTAIALRNWEKSPHGKKIRLILGPALQTIDDLSGPFDLVFIDADKGNYINYWEACVPKVRTGGLILADNVLWSGRVLDPQKPDDHALAAFNAHVRADKRVRVAMLPIQGRRHHGLQVVDPLPSLSSVSVMRRSPLQGA